MKKLLSLALFLLAFTLPPQKRTRVWLIGDSTMADKEIKAYPETGWGMPFHYFFDSTITVDNRAKNGRSTKTFIAEGLWQPVVDAMNEGDYVLIQFGHNDEVKTKASYTTEQEFSDNLARYIREARNKKAIPILITPVARRKYDASGHVQGTHDVYSQLVRNVAKQNDVPLIDLDLESQELLQQLGPESSKLLYNYLSAGEHPNYPDGRQDDTHFSELGARKMAEIVLSDIRKLNIPLASHIFQPLTKK
ncbi:MAG: rhamnogalacturonan acetylesterase [Flavisolibacter sp.]